MNTNKVQVVAATYQVNNDHDETRTHRISASIRSDYQGVIEAIDNGVITSTTTGAQLASFNLQRCGDLQVTFSGAREDQQATLDAVNDFIAACSEEGGDV